MSIDVNLLAVLVGLVLNVLAIAGIVTRSNVRLESRITRLETSLAFLLHMMKVRLESHNTED